jgi:hypothetical protein
MMMMMMMNTREAGFELTVSASTQSRPTPQTTRPLEPAEIGVKERDSVRAKWSNFAQDFDYRQDVVNTAVILGLHET